MRSSLLRILDMVRMKPASFRKYSSDSEQVSPEKRVASISHVLDSLNVLPETQVIDLGTGYGYGAVLLNSLGCNVLGVERNRDKLEDGMNYWTSLGVPFHHVSNASDFFGHPSGLYFTDRDVRELKDVPESSIDLITAFYMSGYMLPEGTFDGLDKMLKPSGHLIITTDGPKSLPSALRGPVAKVGSRLFKPRGFDLAQTHTFNSDVHDKYLFVYKKAA